MNQCVGQFCDYCLAYLSYHWAVEERAKDDDARDYYALAMLHPESSRNAKLTGDKVLLASHRGHGEPYGVIQARHQQPFTLQWTVAGKLPAKWTIEIEGGGKRVFVQEVPGHVRRIAHSGLPILPEVPLGNSTLRGYYAIYATPKAQPRARFLRGVIRVYPNVDAM